MFIPRGKKTKIVYYVSAGALCILTNLGAELDRLCLLSVWKFVRIHVASELEFLAVTTFPFELRKEEVNAVYVLLRKPLSVKMGVYG